MRGSAWQRIRPGMSVMAEHIYVLFLLTPYAVALFANVVPHFSNVDFNKITALATALLAAGTLYIAWNTDRQVSIMENDQRPWIKVETEIAGPFDFYREGPALLPMKFTLLKCWKVTGF
jgi:hypothetical protein